MTIQIKHQLFTFFFALGTGVSSAGVPVPLATVPVRVCVAAPVGDWTMRSALAEATRVLSPLRVNFDWQIARADSQCTRDPRESLPTIDIQQTKSDNPEHVLVSFVHDSLGPMAVVTYNEVIRSTFLPYSTSAQRAMPHLTLGRALARSVVVLLTNGGHDLPKSGLMRDQWSVYDLSAAGSASLHLSPHLIAQLRTAAAEEARNAQALSAQR